MRIRQVLGVGVVLGLLVGGSFGCVSEFGQVADDGFDARPSVYDRTIEAGEVVLIYRDATFYEVVDDPERGHQGYFMDEKVATKPFTPRLLAEVVADHGEWVEVKRVGHREGDMPICGAYSFHDHAWVELRFFVARTELELTVREPVDVSYDDGTEVELLPGVSLEPVEGEVDRYRAWNDDLSFEVDLPAQVVGLGFVPVETRDRTSWSGTPVEPGAVIEINGTALTLAFPERTLAVGWIEERGDRYLVELERECARLVVSIDRDAINRSAGIGGGSGSSGFGCSGGLTMEFHADQYIAREGTPVYWRRGERAGVTTTALQFAAGDVEVGEKICKFESPIIYDLSDAEGEIRYDDVRIEYCYAVEDLRFIPAVGSVE